MEVGIVLNLEIKDSQTGNINQYYCKLIEKNNDYMIIDYPIHTKTKRTSFFSIGTIVLVSYIGDDHAVYQFHSKINARLKMNIPALAINKPEQKDMERIQRREYVRIETAVDIAAHSTDNLFPPLVTLTSDISGGGLSFISEKSINMKIESKVDVWLPLQLQNKEFHYIYSQAEIVYIKEMNSRVNLVSLKFTTISKQDRQNIIRFCFEKQRESRQKELL